MEYVLKTLSLTKSFKEIKVVNNVNMNVKKGDIYGFIGKNGAGKSTFMKMVCGIFIPTSGKIDLFGSNDLTKGRERIGSIIEAPSLYPSMTAKEILEYYNMISKRKNKMKYNDILAFVGLSDSRDKKTKEFSLGMKQRLAIAIALINDADFLILDEPINGLDPTGIKEIRELLLMLNRENSTTILISSHILGELSKISTRYGVIKDGCLVDEFDKAEVFDRCKKYISLEVNDSKKAYDILQNKLGLNNLQLVDGNSIKIFNNFNRMGEINKTLVMDDGITVNSISLAGIDLEDYFISLIGGK